MVNLDMAYNSSGFNAYGRPEAAAFFDSVGRQLATLDTSYHQKLANKAGLHSDHQSFMLEGIPVASPDARWSAEALHCYHADCDQLNWINPEGLDRTARITACLVYALATTDQLPATQLNPAQTKAFLIRNGLEEALRLRGEWK
jgi:Zn-dependent M28 family amino/carboxypeptidase